MVRWLMALTVLALAGVVAVLVWPAGTDSPPSDPGSGKVRYYKAHGPDTDRVFANPSAADRRWALDHWYAGRAYAPFFDGGGGGNRRNNNEWYPRAYLYANAVALYNGDHPDVATSRPRWDEGGVDRGWILRWRPGDGRRAQAFVPFDCGYRAPAGTPAPRYPMCTQYLADVTNPEYRAFLVRWVARQVRDRGYAGVWLDDVNFSDEAPGTPRVNASDGREGAAGKVWPLYRRRGASFEQVTLREWQRGLRLLIEELRSALPSGAALAPNIPIGTIYPDPASNQDLVGAVRATTHVEMERGVTDPCITGGRSRYGFRAFAAWIDLIHRQGKGVIFDALHDWSPGEPDETCGGAETGGRAAAREFTLATYLLFDEGSDQVGFTRDDGPDDYWPGWRTDLGPAEGRRYRWRGVWRRDFARGMVLVNPPDATSRRIRLPEPRRRVGGGPDREKTVLLGPRRGVVYTDAP